MKKIKKRCPWPEDNARMEKYHDTEWGVPQHNDRILFEYMLLDSFQAGLSWAVILNKRENFRRAFDGFDPKKISRYRAPKIQKLLADTGVVRNRLKIEAAVANAKVFLAIQKEFGSFDNYIWGFFDSMPQRNGFRKLEQIPAKTKLAEEISRDLKKRGLRFFGPTTCYAFMQGAGLVNDHLISCFRHREV